MVLLAPSHHSRVASVFLAQDSGSGIAGVFGWSIVLIILVVLAFVGILFIKRWMQNDDIPAGGTGFGLSELRQMHRRGQLTDAEYEAAKEKMTSVAKAMTSKMPDPAGGRRAPGAASPPGGARPDNSSHLPGSQ